MTDVHTHSSAITADIAAAAGVSAGTVLIASVREVALATAASARRRELVDYEEATEKLQMVSENGRVLTTAGVGVEVDVIVTSLAYASATVAISADMSAYMSGAQFLADLTTAIPAVTAVTVTSAVNAVPVTNPTSSDSVFPNSCQLSSDMSIAWSVNTIDDSVQVQLSLNDPDNNLYWISGGLVRSADFMVPKDGHRHSVYKFDPTSDAGYYVINGYLASQIVLDTSVTDNRNKIDSLQQGLGKVQLTFTQVPDVTGTAAFTLDATSAGGSNVFIWAYGGRWPITHTLTDRGFTSIHWAAGTCQSLSRPSALSPFIIFAPLGIVVLFTYFVRPVASGSSSGVLATLSNVLLHYRIPCFHLLDEVSIGGIIIVLLHLTLCVCIGESTYASHSYAGASSTSLDRTGLVLACGRVALVNYWVGLLPAAKTSLWMRLTGVSYERGIKYHKMVAFCAVVATVVHLIASLNDGINSTSQAVIGRATPVFGTLAFVCFATAFVFAVDMVRRFLPHEAFKVTHMLNIIGVVFVLLHLPGWSPALFGFLPGIILHGKYSLKSAALF